MLASGGRNGEVRLWDVASGGHRVLPHRHEDMVYYLAFSPDGGTLASGDDDTGVRLWDVASARPGAAFKEEWPRMLPGRRPPGRILSVTFPPDGGAVAIGGADYAIKRWEIATGELKATLSLETEHMWRVWSVAFSPDGETLASTGHDHAVRLWDVEGRRVRTVLLGHWRDVNALAFSPDGSLLASGSSDLTVRVWELGSGRHRATLGGGAGPVVSVAFSPDGASLANGDTRGQTFLWSVADAGLKAVLKDGTDRTVRSVAFSPDGRTLVSGGGLVRLWDAETGEPRGTLDETPAHSVAYSPDGRTLASGTLDGLVRLWDTDTGELRTTLEGVVSRSVAFSPDGRILAGGGRLVRLWDMDTWESRSVLEGKGGESTVLSVAFSPDGATLASGNSDGTILLWDMSPYLVGPTSVGLSPALPDRTALLASYPNPFNQETWIPFQLHAPARVRLTIHDVRGARVREIDLGHRPAGWYRASGRAARWDGRDQRGEPLASGVYFVRLWAGPAASVRKMLLLK